MAEQKPVTGQTDEITYCAVHPNRETSLRCNKCGRLMCVECAVQTPVGYRCRECVRSHENKFYSATRTDYAVIFAICAGLGLVGGVIVSMIPMGILSFFPAVLLGGVMSEAALRAVDRRRGRYSPQAAVAAAVIGGLLGSPVYLLLRFGVFVIIPEVILRDIGLLIYVGVVAFSVYGMFRVRI